MIGYKKRKKNSVGNGSGCQQDIINDTSAKNLVPKKVSIIEHENVLLNLFKKYIIIECIGDDAAAAHWIIINNSFSLLFLIRI